MTNSKIYVVAVIFFVVGAVFTTFVYKTEDASASFENEVKEFVEEQKNIDGLFMNCEVDDISDTYAYTCTAVRIVEDQQDNIVAHESYAYIVRCKTGITDSCDIGQNLVSISD